MSQDSPDSTPSNKTVLWIVMIVAAVIIVVVLVCGGVAFVALQFARQAATTLTDVVKDMAAAPAEAELFLSDLTSNQVDAAYARTSGSFQTQWTPQAFRDYVTKHPILTRHTSRTSQSMGINNGTAMLRYTLVGPTSTDTCSLQLVKEKDQWKISQFSVP
jgi:hypothetical protein